MNKNGKYLVFAWQVSNQKGGMHDLVGSVDRLEATAIESTLKQAMDESRIDKYVDHIQVVDKVTHSIVKHQNIPEFYEHPDWRK